MQIFPLSEGTFTVDRSKQFVPFDAASDDLQARPVGSLLVEIQPFAVVTENDIVLFDTGLGFSSNGRPQIYDHLAQHNLDPLRVSKVLMSHLHKDHSGAVATMIHGSLQLCFPNATYYIQRQELELALEKKSSSYAHLSPD
ncbi:MAG TPA: MBL fold metallo-hydrolase, partial [Chitinophagaceae bacterium]